MTEAEPIIPRAEKDRIRAEIEAQTAEFLKIGGKVSECETGRPGQSGVDDWVGMDEAARLAGVRPDALRGAVITGYIYGVVGPMTATVKGRRMWSASACVQWAKKHQPEKGMIGERSRSRTCFTDQGAATP